MAKAYSIDQIDTGPLGRETNFTCNPTKILPRWGRACTLAPLAPGCPTLFFAGVSLETKNHGCKNEACFSYPYYFYCFL